MWDRLLPPDIRRNGSNSFWNFQSFHLYESCDIVIQLWALHVFCLGFVYLSYLEPSVSQRRQILVNSPLTLTINNVKIIPGESVVTQYRNIVLDTKSKKCKREKML